MKTQNLKSENVEAQNNEIRLKLMQKEEELKKSFNTIQNLKGTIGELEIGIDTYHGYV